MKTIILENGFEVDIPERLQRYLKSFNIDYTLLNTSELFYPENLTSTLQKFNQFPDGQEFLCDTCFYYSYQLERGIQLLHSLKDKNFKIQFISYSIPSIFLKYLKEQESGITPKELFYLLDSSSSKEEYEEKYSKIEDFKREMNKKFFEVLQYHRIYLWLPFLPEPKRLQSIQDLEEFQ